MEDNPNSVLCQGANSRLPAPQFWFNCSMFWSKLQCKDWHVQSHLKNRSFTMTLMSSTAVILIFGSNTLSYAVSTAIARIHTRSVGITVQKTGLRDVRQIICIHNISKLRAWASGKGLELKKFRYSHFISALRYSLFGTPCKRSACERKSGSMKFESKQSTWNQSPIHTYVLGICTGA